MASGFTNEDGMDDEEDGFFVRHRISLIVGGIAVILLGIAAFFMANTARQPPVHQVETITIVPVRPPPPPPPPPPPQQQMIQQPKITMPIPKPTEPAPPTKVAPPKPAAPAATPMGTSIKGNSPNNFDLTGNAGGDGLLDGGGGGGGGAWSYYSGQAQDRITAALEKNPGTRHATAGLQVKIWVDSNGLISRIVLIHPSGNPTVDAAIERQVLPKLPLGVPPAGMPMPMNVSLTGQEPL